MRVFTVDVVRAPRLLAVVLILESLSIPVFALSELDEIEVLDPGVSVRLICTLENGSCLFGDPNDPLDFYNANAVGSETINFPAKASTLGPLGESYVFRSVFTGPLSCAPPGANTHRHEFLRVFTDGRVEPVFALSPTCVGDILTEFLVRPQLIMDAVNGRSQFSFRTIRDDCSNPQNCIELEVVHEVIEVSGLPSLLDIIPTFDPGNTATLSWVAPVKPEAMAASDGYDVYKGDIDAVSDLSLAVSLACDVPTGRDPVPGEFLSVTDTIPALAAGEARYYLIANRFAGQSRAGREFMGGVLRGRDASLLTSCP